MITTGTRTSEYKIVLGLVLLVIVGAFAALATGILGDGATGSDRAFELIKWVLGTSGLLGSGYAVSRGLAKSGRQDGGHARPLLLMLMTLALGLVLFGCGMSNLERLEYAGKTARSVWTHGHPVLTARAEAEAKKCRAAAPSSQPVALTACPGADKAIKALKALRAACDSVDAAVIIGAPMALSDAPGVDGWVAVALSALRRAVSISQTAGLLPAGG